SGAIHAGCHHAGCGGGRQRWQELRAMHEKEYRERDSPSHQAITRSPAGSAPDQPGSGPPITPPPPEGYALTDAGNAERLIAQCGEDIRYCPTTGSWYLWNGTVWEQD